MTEVEARFKCISDGCDYDRAVVFMSDNKITTHSKQVKANMSFMDDKKSLERQLTGHPVSLMLKEQPALVKGLTNE